MPTVLALAPVLLGAALAQCSGPECCTAEEVRLFAPRTARVPAYRVWCELRSFLVRFSSTQVRRHQCNGPCYDIAGEEQPCLAADSTCTQCMNGLTPPIPLGQNLQMSCTGTPSDTPVSRFVTTARRAAGCQLAADHCFLHSFEWITDWTVLGLNRLPQRVSLGDHRTASVQYGQHKAAPG